MVQIQERHSGPQIWPVWILKMYKNSKALAGSFILYITCIMYITGRVTMVITRGYGGGNMGNSI